jgi:hypothetical protein
MKKLSCLIIAILFLFSCQKWQDYEYTLICDLPFYAVEKATLVVTHPDGEVLKAIDLPKSGNEIRQTFTLTTKKPLDAYDIHVVLSDLNGQVNKVYTQLSVKNAGNIALEASVTPAPLGVTRKVRIALPVTNYAVHGCPINELGETIDKKKELELTLGTNQGILIDREPNWPSQRTFKYVASEDIKPVMHFNAEDFVKPTEQLRPSANLDLSNLQEIYAVSPDFQRYVCIYEGRAFNEDIYYLAIPEGIDPSWKLYIKYQDSNLTTEKFFDQFELITPPKPSINIVNSEFRSNKFVIRFAGPVDFAKAYAFKFEQDPGSHDVFTSWYVQGPPSRLESYELPDLSQFVHSATGKVLSNLFNEGFTVVAYHATQLSYEDMVKGFPWKSTDLFAKGKAGYEHVFK